MVLFGELMMLLLVGMELLSVLVLSMLLELFVSMLLLLSALDLECHHYCKCENARRKERCEECGGGEWGAKFLLGKGHSPKKQQEKNSINKQK